MTYTTTFRALLTLCSFFFALAANSQTTLVETNSVFQYYDNGDQPANDAAGNAWYSTDYNATWSSFEGPLGYGAGDHNEILDPSSNTVYFRHQWKIESTADFDLMFFNLLYNDGAIIYLNGKLINRVNMPQGEVSYDTYASSNVEDQKKRNIALPHLFVNGINTVAIEVHNSSDSGDNNLSFGLEVIEYHEVCEIVGQTCNDDQAHTIDDKINEDCECVGTDCGVGTPCDDGNQYTHSDTINDECECVGIICDLDGDVEGPSSIIEGQTAILRASGGESYVWENGSTGSTLEVSPKKSTTYAVDIIAADGCSEIQSVSVDVMACPSTGKVQNEYNIEVGEAVTLSASGGRSYMWSTGSSDSEIEVAPEADTSYVVTIFQWEDCYEEFEVFVNVSEPSFEVSISGDTLITVGESAVLAALGADSYTWNDGQTGSVIEVEPTETTTYSVKGKKGTVTKGATIIVRVIEKTCEVGEACDDQIDGTYNDQLNEDCECLGTPCHMDVEIGGDEVITEGETATIVVEGGVNYIWDNGAVGPVQVVSPTETTTYNVTVIADNGCEDFTSFTVEVLEPACEVGEACDDQSDGTYNDQLNEDCDCVGFPCHMDVEIGGDALIAEGGTATITAEGGINYIWDNGSVGPTIEVSPSETTEYTVTIIDTNGCQEIISFKTLMAMS